MRGNAQKLYCILALSVFLLSTHAVRAASTVYDVVSPGTLQPGSPVPPPAEPVVLTVRGRLGLASAEAGVTFDMPTLERLGLIRFTTPTAWTDVRTWPVLIALKRDGQYMSIRNKGPLWVVYPRHAFPELEQAKHNSKWIWQLKEIVLR